MLAWKAMTGGKKGIGPWASSSLRQRLAPDRGTLNPGHPDLWPGKSVPQLVTVEDFHPERIRPAGTVSASVRTGSHKSDHFNSQQRPFKVFDLNIARVIL